MTHRPLVTAPLFFAFVTALLTSCSQEPTGQPVSLSDADRSKVPTYVKDNRKEDFAWRIKAEALERDGKFAEALFCYDQILRLAATARRSDEQQREILDRVGWRLAQSTALMAKARILQRMDYPEAALRASDQAIQVNSAEAEPWYRKGELLMRQGQYSKAMNGFEHCLDLWGQSGKLMKGLCLYQMNRKDEARQCVREAFIANPRLRRSEAAVKAASVLKELGF